MFFKRGVKSAKRNVYKYERKLDKTEFNFIIQSIKNISRQGYNGLRWDGDIRKTNINNLKKLGYKVYQTSCHNYEIRW